MSYALLAGIAFLLGIAVQRWTAAPAADGRGGENPNRPGGSEGGAT